MASNITVKVTADTASLQAQLALAKVKLSDFNSELRSNAKAMNDAGESANDNLKAKTLQAAEAVTRAKAQVAELNGELKTGQSSASGFGTAISQANALLGQFGIALSVASAAAFVKSTFEFAADLQRQADALEMNVERLQAFQFAARQAGVDTDETTQATKRFIANLGQLQTTGEGPLANDLQTLGLTADELAGDPSEALVIFARAMDQIKDATVRAAIERDAFGRSGVDLTAFLHELAKNGGDVADALDRITNSARAAGEMIDEKTTKAAAAFDTQLQSLVVHGKAEVADFFRREVEGWEGIATAIGHALEQQTGWEASVGQAQPKSQQGIPPNAAEAAAFKAQGFRPQPPNVAEPKITIVDPEQAARDAARAAEEARRLADEITQIYQQADLAHLQSEEQTNSYLLQSGQETNAQFITQAEALENQRIAVQLRGIKQREQQDAGNANALKKDEAEAETLERAHQDRMTHLHEQATTQYIADENAKHDAAIKGADAAAQEQIKDLELLAQAHVLTTEEEMAQERQIESQRYAQVQSQIASEILSNKDRTTKLEENEKQHQDRMAEIARQGVQHRLELEQQFAGEVVSAQNEIISGVFSGQQKIGQIVEQAALHFGEALIEKKLETLTQSFVMDTVFGEKEVARTALTEQGKVAATAAGTAARSTIGAAENTSFFGRIATQVEEWLGLETAKTADTVTGATARGATAATESVATIAAAKAQAIGEIPAYTGIAAMEAASAVAAIPIVGPALATAAVSEMDALGAAQLSLASAEGGMERVPADGTLILAHKDESVLPAMVSRPLMSFAGDLPAVSAAVRNSIHNNNISVTNGGNRDAGFRGGNVMINHNVQALDGKSVANFYRRSDVRRAQKKELVHAVRSAHGGAGLTR